MIPPGPAGSVRLLFGRWPRRSVTLLAVLLIFWLAASAAAERMVLHPRRWGDGPTPASVGLAYRDVTFQDPAHITLRGWWIPGAVHRTIVMVHGWTSSRRETFEKSVYLHRAGYNVLVFDLRGHGSSGGSYTTMGWKEPSDVRAAVSFAARQDPGPIALIGYSMGGSLVVEEGAFDPRVKAVVEDSGFSSLSAVFTDQFSRLTHLPAWPFDLPMLAIGRVDLGLNPAAVRPLADVARLHKPFLAIIGTADTMVPPSEGMALYRAAPGPKQLLVIPGAQHVSGYRVANRTYEQTVLAFLAGAFARP